MHHALGGERDGGERDEAQKPTTSTEGDEEDWHTRAWELFMRMSRRGVIGIDELAIFAVELNVDCDLALVKKLVPESKWDAVTFDMAMVALEKIPQTVLADDNADSEGEEADTNVVVVGPLEYLWRVILCGHREPDKTYEVAVQHRLSPQFWLLFNAALVFIVVSAAIILLMSLLWLSTSMSRERQSLASFQSTLHYFLQTMSSSALKIESADIEDQVATLSRWIEFMWVTELNELRAHLGTEITSYSGLVEGAAADAVNLSLEALQTKVDALADITGATGASRGAGGTTADVLTQSTIIALAKLWTRNTPWRAVVYDLFNNRVAYSDAAEGVVFATTRCFSAIAGPKQAGSVVERNVRGLTSANDTVVFRQFPFATCGVCFSLSRRGQSALAVTHITPLLEAINAKAKLSPVPTSPQELILIAPSTYFRATQPPPVASANENVLLVAAPADLPTPIQCQSSWPPPNCTVFMNLARECYRRRCTAQRNVSWHYTMDQAIMYFQYVASFDFVLAIAVSEAVFLEVYRDRIVSTVNFINPRFESTTEIVVSAFSGTGTVIPQITDLRFKDACRGVCRRYPQYASPLYQALRKQGTTADLYMDYRPEPVIGAFSFTGDGLGTVFSVERDVAEVRTDSLVSLARALDGLNDAVGDSTEVMLFHNQGLPLTATIALDTPCDDEDVCVTVPGVGVVARRSCPDCTAVPRSTTTSSVVEYVTKVRYPNRCPVNYRCNRSSKVQPNADNSIGKLMLAGKTEQTVALSGFDYSGVEIIGTASYLVNYSTVLHIKRDREEIYDPVLRSILTLVGVSVGLVVSGVLGLVFLSRRTLNKIEAEWKTYKRSIESEQTKFDEMLREIVPSTVFARFQRGQRAVTETHQCLSFAFVDICSFSEKCKGLNAKHVVRLAAYYFALYDVVASKMQIFRLKCFGDVCLFVSGLDQPKTAANGSRGAMDIARFAGTLIQLLSPVYAHFPMLQPLLLEVFKGEPVEPVTMMPVRIGLHSGPSTSGLIDIGKTPFYELYGATLGVCQRLQGTCPPAKAHASGMFKELVESADNDGMFEFDSMRKTMVKGRGAIASYPIKSVHLPIDEFILNRLKIEFAQSMHDYQNKDGTSAGTAETEKHNAFMSETSSVRDSDKGSSSSN